MSIASLRVPPIKYPGDVSNYRFGGIAKVTPAAGALSLGVALLKGIQARRDREEYRRMYDEQMAQQKSDRDIQNAHIQALTDATTAKTNEPTIPYHTGVEEPPPKGQQGPGQEMIVPMGIKDFLTATKNDQNNARASERMDLMERTLASKDEYWKNLLSIQEERLKLSEEKATGQLGDLREQFFSTLARTTSGGNKVIKIPSYLPQASKEAAAIWGTKNGYIPIDDKQDTQLSTVETAKRNIDLIRQYGQGIWYDSPATGGYPAPGQRNLLNMSKRAGQEFTQSDERLAPYRGFRVAAITALRAMTPGNGFRINQAEIQAAIKYDTPTEFERYGVATKKLDNVQAMLQNVEDSVLGKPWHPTVFPHPELHPVDLTIPEGTIMGPQNQTQPSNVIEYDQNGNPK